MVSPAVFRTVYDLIRSQLGADNLDFQEGEIVDVDIADKVILKGSPGRGAFVVINLGSAAIFLRPGAPAVTTFGIRLGPSGGSLSVNWLDDLILPSLEWHGVSGSNNQAIYVLEVLLR